MRSAGYILILAVLFYGCLNSSGNNETAEDSVQYYPPTPGQLDKQQFRHYYRVLSSFFDSNLLHNNFNGGILIAKDGSIVYEKYSGYTDLRTRDTLTDSSALHIASASKPFTAMAVLQMAERRQLSIDDSLGSFFPGFPYPGITVKMLMNHRSGLPNYMYFMSEGGWDKTQYVTNNDVLNFIYSQKPKLSFPAGTRFSYSNTNFVLLALIIEKISGLSYPAYMRKEIFGPIGMKDTYVLTLADTLTAIPSFDWNGNFWKNDFLEATYGDKNIYSTPRDLLKWDQVLYSGQFLQQPLLDSAFTPYSFEKEGKHNYGLGWRLLILPGGKKVIYHFGRWHGFNAAFARLTDEKATIIILGNRFTRSIYDAALKAYDIFGNYLESEGEDDETDSSAPKKEK